MPIAITDERQVGKGSDYAGLLRQVRAAGLLERRPVSYVLRAASIIALYAGAWIVVGWLGDSWLQVIPAV